MAWRPNKSSDPVDPVPPTPQAAATLALAQARRYRHHRSCTCFTYARLYCSAADALWSRALDRELDKL